MSLESENRDYQEGYLDGTLAASLQYLKFLEEMNEKLKVANERLEEGNKKLAEVYKVMSGVEYEPEKLK